MKAISFLLAGLSGLAIAAESPTPGTVPEGLATSDWSSIRAAYEAGRHAVQRQENGTLTAPNPGQQWRAEFDGAGFTITPNHRQWTWGLELAGYGLRNLLPTAPAITYDGGKITCQRDENLTEWFINDRRGLEQGWTFRHRPAHTESAAFLYLHLSTRGDLQPRVSADGSTVSFELATGTPALTYGGLKAWDADGKTLLVSFEQSNGNGIRIAIDERNARYPITIDPIAQQAYLKASNTPDGIVGVNDTFGSSVAVSGDTVVIGAPGEASNSTGINTISNENSANSGAAYVFVRNGQTWTQQAYLKASNTGADDSFGQSVAISGDTLVVGAHMEDSSSAGVNGNQADDSASGSGAVYIFTRSGTSWIQQAYLKASNTGANDRFGYSVAISADTVVVSSPWETSNATGVNGNQADNSFNSAGAAYIFTRNGTLWTQSAYLKASNTGVGDTFGYSVSISIDTVIVGSPYESSNATGVNGSEADNSANSSGAAYIFTHDGTVWTQQAYVKASNTELGDQFGFSVSVSGNTVLVGAYQDDSSATGVNGNQASNSAVGSGAAYVFTRNASVWTQQAYLKASNTQADDNFGLSVALSGDTAVICGWLEDSNATGVNGNQTNNSATESGAAYIFTRTGSIWTQQAYLKSSNTDANDYFGSAVAISGETVVVGARWEDSDATGVDGNQTNNSATASGAAYVFTRTGSIWTQQAYTKAGNNGGSPSDGFGFSVAVSGDTVVVGAYLEDSNATGVNGNQADNSAPESGAAYIFIRTGSTWTQQAYLKASNTEIYDNFGYSVAISGDTVVVGAYYEDSNATGANGNQASNSVIDSGAVYVFTRSGTTWAQQAYLKASNTGASDLFGNSVAVSGDILVVGAHEEDSSATGVNGNQTNNSIVRSGAAYVFTRNGTAWAQQAYLKASNTGANDVFGFSVAVDGDTIVVGAYEEDSNAVGLNGDQTNNSATNSGAAYVFTRSGTTWSQQAYLKASNTQATNLFASDYFGYSVAISGDTLIAGAPQERSNAIGVNGNQADNSFVSAGAAYVFTRSGTAWSQQAYLKASNTGANDKFGYSVALAADIVVVGSPLESSNATGVDGSQTDNSSSSSGAAYVFRRSGMTWTQSAYLKASNTGPDDWFGASVGVSGGTAVVGAHREDSSASGVDGDQANNSALNSGAAYPFDLASVLAAPEIAVEQAASNIPSGGTKGFGSVATNSSYDLVFTILNNGSADLTFPSSPVVAVTGSGDFTVVTQPASPIAAGGSATFTARFTPIGEGGKAAAFSIANNDLDENPFLINLSGTGATSAHLFDGIAAAAGLIGPDASPTAIPFTDGVENLLKYAFNMNLSGPDSAVLAAGTGIAGLPAIGLTGTGPGTMIRVEFIRRKRSGLIYTPKRSSTLDPGSFVPMGGTPVVTSINADWERVVVQESADPATLPSTFAIIEVTLP